MDCLAHELREDAPVARSGPGDVGEVEDGGAGDLFADAGGGQVEVVVLEEDEGRLRVVLSLGGDGVGDRLVDGDVAALPGLVDGAADVGRARRVPHVVLEEPEQGVAEDVVVPLVDVAGHDDEADVDLVIGELEEAAVGLFGGAAVAVGHGGGDPGGGEEAGGGGEGGDHAAAAAAADEGAVVLDAELQGAAVAGDDQAALRQHLLAEVLQPLELAAVWAFDLRHSGGATLQDGRRRVACQPRWPWRVLMRGLAATKMIAGPRSSVG